MLNIVALVKGDCYLIGVERMTACNHATFSQSIVKVVGDIGIKFEHVTAIISDGAAYCKKAYREILSEFFRNLSMCGA